MRLLRGRVTRMGVGRREGEGGVWNRVCFEKRFCVLVMHGELESERQHRLERS